MPSGGLAFAEQDRDDCHRLILREPKQQKLTMIINGASVWSSKRSQIKGDKTAVHGQKRRSTTRGAPARRAGAGCLLYGGDRRQARRARRGPGVGAHRRPRQQRRGQADRQQAPFRGLPAGHGGLRHHRQPDRLRHPGAADPPGRRPGCGKTHRCSRRPWRSCSGSPAR